MKKKILIILIVIILILLFRYITNKIFVNNYNKGNNYPILTRINMIINYPEPYVAYYNYGNSLYSSKLYKKSIIEYNKALKTVPTNKECKVISNLSMAMFNAIDSNITDSQELITELEEIEEVLISRECAKEDGTGRDENSQEIYNLIEEMINKLKDGSATSTENIEEEQEDESSSDDLKDKLLETQKDAQEERENANKHDDISKYKGKKW